MKLLKRLSLISLSSMFMLGIIISTASAEEGNCDPADEQSVCL